MDFIPILIMIVLMVSNTACSFTKRRLNSQVGNDGPGICCGTGYVKKRQESTCN
ncbi:MAG: hypothetical protein ACTSRA_21430 [Promethearchaeota archaeon]